MSEIVKSEVTTPGEGQPKEIPTPPQVSLDDVMLKLAQAEKTNQRLLSESKENKAKAQFAKEELEKREMETLTKSKDHEKINEMLKSQLDSERTQAKSFKKTVVSKLLDAEIMRLVPDVLDVHLFKQSLPADLINVIEEDNEIKFTGLAEGAEHVKKTKPFLIKSNSNIQMVTGKPAGNNNLSHKSSPLSNAKTSEDIMNYWKANPHIK